MKKRELINLYSHVNLDNLHRVTPDFIMTVGQNKEACYNANASL